MKTASPLRYPGGKSSMSGLLSRIRTINDFGDRSVAEPFAGGSGASLSLLFREDTHEVFINDIDVAIFDFWWSILNQPEQFISLLRSTRVSMAEWRRQRDTYRRRSRVSRLRRGFAAFYLNRCNRSGIIMNGGPIGGIQQTGQWKLNARYNKSELEKRCAKVADYGERIHATQLDALDFIRSFDPDSVFFFIDPPYYTKGPTLYMNRLNHAYHQELADELSGMTDRAWVLTYDDCPEIRRMYTGWAHIRPFTLRYVASDRRSGREIMITPRWMQLPRDQESATIEW